MKLEAQVVNLELSKKLKSLGLPQESLFYWENLGHRWSLEFQRVKSEGVELYSAFSVAELWDDMPFGIRVWNQGNGYYCDNGSPLHSATDKKLADALAKLRIHLIEQNLIDPNKYFGEFARLNNVN